MKKVKVIFLRGLPASGKTTWSKQFIKENPNYMRVNRDDIRNMLSIKWDKEKEKVVKNIQVESIFSALNQGYNVIVDDTNLDDEKLDILKEKIYECMVFSKNYEVKFSEKVFYISLKEAIKRDSKRENQVGQTVIELMSKKSKNVYIKKA